jgi:hypothetical protein
MRMAGKGDQLDRLDSKRGKDGPALNPEAYGYVQERNGHSRFYFDTSAEIVIGTHETTGNNVVKIYKPTLKELEDWLRDLLSKNEFAHVHGHIGKFLKVHIEEQKPLPIKPVYRFGQ